MTIATRKPPKLRRITLSEDVRSSVARRVDRDKGIIYECKILGPKSANNRRYTRTAYESAVKLYEGRKVYADHPAKASDPRSIREVFGWFENVKARSDGLYGDFHLVNPNTELSESVMNAAENKPDLYGFSHNAMGEGDEVDGEFVVGRITEVRSVDLVDDPATTKSLFEGRTMKKIKLRKLLEWVKPQRAPAKKLLKSILEGPDDAPMDMDLDVPDDMPVEAPAEGGGMDALTSAIAAIVKDGNHDLAMKVLKLIKSDAEPEAPEPEEPTPEGEGEGEGKPKDEDDDKDKKMESLQRKLANLESDKAIRVLIEDASLKFTKPEHREAFIESLLPLTDAKRKALIEERKSLLQESTSRHDRPRSQGPASSGAGTKAAAKNGKDLAEAIIR